MYINQVFELSMVLDRERFEEILESSYCGDDYIDENEDRYIDCSLEEDGIVFVYRNSQYKKKIKVIVNSTVLMSGEESSAHKLVRRLDKHLSEYFHREYQLEDFDVTGATYTTDIQIGNQEKLRAYMKVLQRIGKVKKFSPVDFEEASNAFCLEGNSNGIDFLVYDLHEAIKKRIGNVKKYKVMNDGSDGILRAEVRLKKPKAIRLYTDEVTTSEQVVALSEKCRKIFFSVVTQIIPYGNFFKKSDAISIIYREVTDPALRRRMIHLVTLIPEKKSLLLAQKGLNYRHVEDVVMAAFAKIGLSPITIGKRQDIKHLENFYSYLI